MVTRIVELRQAGLTIQKIADTLGVSRGSVGNYSAAPPKPIKAPSRGRGRPAGRKEYLFDDPRFADDLDADPYADVIPLPFFPADLPRLELDPFWTPERLDDACQRAKVKRLSQGRKT